MVKSARSSNPSKLFFASLIVLGCSSFSGLALAQSAPGYAPPPMFDDMTPPMVRPQPESGYIVEPKASQNPGLPPPVAATPDGKPPVIAPRVSVDPDGPRAGATTTNTTTAPAATAPSVPPVKPRAPVVPSAPAKAPAASVAKPAVPPQKPEMMKPIVEEVYIKRDKKPETAVKPPAAPKSPPAVPAPASPVAPAAKEASPSAPAQAIRDPKVSAIQGPKTMPALPAQDVQGEVMFDAKDPATAEPTIFERQQQQAVDQKKEQATLTPVVPRPKDGVAPANFETAEQDVLKKSFTFQPGQITMAESDTDAVAAGVVKQLDENERKDWRVQIKSYATPYGSGLSSDRRIALSRALSLRSSLITQGVSASRIDVLAEGLQSDNSRPGDRIDLYLYGPSANSL